MVIIEGDLAIHPTSEGLFVASIEPDGGKAFYVHSDGKRSEIVRKLDGYVTLVDGDDEIHLS